MRCSQCNSLKVMPMGKGYWCPECMGFVEVFDEQAEPKPTLAYKNKDSANCPFCNSSNLGAKDGRVYCEDCQREIVEISDGATPPPPKSTAGSTAAEANVSLKCPFCNAASVVRKDGKLFCQACGFEVGSPELPNAPMPPAFMIKCPVCSQRLSAKAESCPACGHPLGDSSKMTTRKVLRIIFWVLVVIFFAWLILPVVWAWIYDAYVHS